MKRRETGPNKAAKVKDAGETDDGFFSYFSHFLDDKGIAAVTPSSKYLVRRALEAMEPGKAEVIIEYGAAYGVMTQKILAEMPAKGKLLAIELNDRLFDALKNLSDPRVRLVHGDVREIGAIAKRFAVEQADVIVSGIPFAFLLEEERRELLAKTWALLKPGGRFVAYQITTHLVPLLKERFKRVKIEYEIRNLPPHFVFTAFK